MLPELATNLATAIIGSVVENTPNTSSEMKTRQEREMGHAKDVAQWITQLNPSASVELLMAGWLHDSERLVEFDGTTGYKGDRSSDAYLEHKKNHAKRSADLAKNMLQKFDWSESSVERVYFLILHHDDTGEEIDRLGDTDLTTLAAADSFSFFTYIAPDMLGREDETRLQDKANFMVGKMTPTIRQLLAKVNLDDPTISRVKEKALASFPTCV